MEQNINNEKKSTRRLGSNYYIISFKRGRRGYFIDRNKLELNKDEWVIVQAEKGHDMGRVQYQITENQMEDDSHRYPLEVLRKATPEDIDKYKTIRTEEKEMFRMCDELIGFRGLEMKLVDVEQQFDGSKITFFFTAPERVDFRQLVRDLASYYRVRIELRQIGARDESKKLGGMGPCGLTLCCKNFMKKFDSIPTQLARSQGLAVNPSKISGLCGRLMCCLSFEQEYYDELASQIPNIGETVETTHGEAKVEDINFLKKIISLRYPDSNVEQISFIELKKRLKDRKAFLEKWKKG